MKSLYIFFVLLFSSEVFFAQTNGQEDEYVLTQDSLTTKDRLHYNFAVGVGVGFSNHGSNSLSTYYKPSISYDVSPKFKINTGLLYVNSSANNVVLYSDYQYRLFSGSISDYYAYIGGQYQMNDKLSIGGSIFYNVADFKSYNGLSVNHQGTNNGSWGYSANFKYKVTKGLTLEGQIRVTDSTHPNAFNNNQMGMSNSFFGNGCGSPFRTW